MSTGIIITLVITFYILIYLIFRAFYSKEIKGSAEILAFCAMNEVSINRMPKEVLSKIFKRSDNIWRAGVTFSFPLYITEIIIRAYLSFEDYRVK